MSETTLRDQFAMAALNGYLGNDTLLKAADRCADDRGSETTSDIAIACYEYADAMLKARANPPEDK